MDLESEAYREALAVAPSDRVVIDTLEVSVPDLDSIYITNNYHGFQSVDEGNNPIIFLPIPFKVKLPTKGKNELPTMTVAIANPNQLVSDYIRTAKTARHVVTIKFRPYLSVAGGASAPQVQLPVPMTFVVGSVSFGIDKVECQCVFPNIENKRFPNQMYTARLFPGLRGW